MYSEVMNPEINSSIRKQYGLEIAKVKPLKNVYGGIWEITTNKDVPYIVKDIGPLDKDALFKLQGRIAFAEFINNHMTNLKSVRFLSNQKGETVTEVSGSNNSTNFFIMEKERILHRWKLNSKQTQQLGALMADFHRKMEDFDHPGIKRRNDFFTVFTDQERDLLKKSFPEGDHETYIEEFGYDKTNWKVTTIHGDWHSNNMSWVKPPLLLDLDTVAKATRIDEIARTLSHWWFKDADHMANFTRDLIAGYAVLNPDELAILPRFILRDLYKSYCEFYLVAHQRKGANNVKKQIAIAREAFKLD